MASINSQIEIPWIINVELTNACNLACIFCDREVLQTEMTVREMDCSFLEKILLEAKNDIAQLLPERKIHELGLVGLGEPTLDRILQKHLSIVDAYSNLFDRISINSNLVFLNEKQAEILLESKVNAYTFSVNASNREGYFKLMQRDCFETVVKNLKTFLEILRIKNKNISIGVQVMDSPLNDLTKLQSLFSGEEKARINFFVRKIYSKPILYGGSKFLNIDEPNTGLRYPCWDLYSNVYIDVEGNMYACTIGNDSYRNKSNLCLGNISSNSLLSLFNNEKMVSSRRESEKGNIPFPECQRCNSWAVGPNNFEWLETEKLWIKKKKQVRAFGLK